MTMKTRWVLAFLGALTALSLCDIAECGVSRGHKKEKSRDTRDSRISRPLVQIYGGIPVENQIQEVASVKASAYRLAKTKQVIGVYVGYALDYAREQMKHLVHVLSKNARVHRDGEQREEEVVGVLSESGIVIAKGEDLPSDSSPDSKSRDRGRGGEERALLGGSGDERQRMRQRIAATRRRRAAVPPKDIDIAKVMREAWRNVHLATYTGARVGTCRSDLPRVANSRGDDYLTRVVKDRKSGNTASACTNLATGTILAEVCLASLTKAGDKISAKFLATGAGIMRTTLSSLGCKSPPRVSLPPTNNPSQPTTGLPVGDGDGPSPGATFEDAGNWIDACWFNPGWASNDAAIKAYAACAPGYGGLTNDGGSKGEVYHVTDTSDNPRSPPVKGTLRYATDSDEFKGKPVWVVFDRDMTITLKMELSLPSYITIDGRGKSVTITGFGFVVKQVSNVIVTSLVIRDINWGESKYNPSGSRGDGIIIFGSSDIWLDHLSISNCPGKPENGGPTGKLIDVVMGSTRVTISNSRFANQMFTILLGASDLNSDIDLGMRVSLMLNVFEDTLVQRMPRCRFGKFHVLNNIYNKWGFYAIGGSASPEIRSEGNVFIAPDNKNMKSVTQRMVSDTIPSWSSNWKSLGDSLENGAYFEESGDGIFDPPYRFTALPAAQVRTATARAGQSPFRTV